MIGLIIVILLLIFFAPVLGITLTYGFGTLFMLSIPILLILCFVAYLILKPFIIYWDWKEEKQHEGNVKRWTLEKIERDRKEGVLAYEDSKAIQDFYNQHGSFRKCPTYNSLSPEQKHSAHSKMNDYYPGSVRIVHKDIWRTTYEPT